MNIEIGIYKIRKFVDSDVYSLSEHANNPNIARNLRDAFPYPYTEEEAKMWIARAIKERPNSDFAITHDNKVIGGIGFNLLDDVFRKSAEIGYWVSEKYWGKGIPTNAVREITRYAFENFDIERLFTGVFSNNQASIKVLQKNGFVHEGCLRRSVYEYGKYLDQQMYARIRDEWQREN